MRKFQKEYEEYMKKVTDAFVEMNSDRIYGTNGNSKIIDKNSIENKSEVFYEVIWNGGLDYFFDLNFSKYIKGVTFKEIKKYNAEISKKYLEENIISYEQWLKKYKNE